MKNENGAGTDIFLIRGRQVMLDAEVARRLGVKTGPFNQTIKRNWEKFGDDFAFQLSEDEWSDLKSQNVISSGHGGRRSIPIAFSEHGVVMAATLLKSPEAVAASRHIVQTFVLARRAAAEMPKGQNLPATIDPAEIAKLAPVGGGLRQKLNDALGRVLDAIADPVAQTTIRDEARDIALEAMNALKAQLQKGQLANEKTFAEIRKLLHEAEKLGQEAESVQIENEHRRLAYLAKQLRVVLAAQDYMNTGSVSGFLEVLKEIGE